MSKWLSCRQKARITLTGNTKQPLSGYDDVGFKVLAAYGGQLNLFGALSSHATANAHLKSALPCHVMEMNTSSQNGQD